MAEVRVINPSIDGNKPKLRVAAYCRVSSGSDEQLDSYAAQVKAYTAAIAENPEWELADIYADEAVTGTRTDKREDFNRMLADCRKGKIDKILVKSISRFSRNTRDSLQSIRELTSLGVEVVFEKENINTAGMSNEFMLGTYSSFAQRESESISGNMRWSYKKRMESGEFITCYAPFGYRLENRMLYINEKEAEVVRRIFREYLDGKGRREIADGLNRDGIPKRNGNKEWQKRYISEILQNERYKGDALLQKKYTTETLPYLEKRNNGERGQYYLHNSHTAIISEPEFDAAQAIAANRNMDTRKNSVNRIFTQRIKCGVCGNSFKYKAFNGKKYWMCRTHEQSKELCPIKQIPEPELHAAFICMADKLKRNSRYILHSALTQLQDLKSKVTYGNEKIGAINLKIAELTEQNLVLARLKSKGYLDSVLFMEQSNEIARKINALKADKRRLSERNGDDKVIREIQSLIARIESADPSCEFDEDLFNDTVENIIVESQTSVKFRLTGGLELPERIKETVR